MGDPITMYKYVKGQYRDLFHIYTQELEQKGSDYI